jgi:uncharacterized membrane protein
MTLLVIELKLPEHGLVHSADQLAGAWADLLPKALSWALSFFVLPSSGSATTASSPACAEPTAS